MKPEMFMLVPGPVELVQNEVGGIIGVTPESYPVIAMDELTFVVGATLVVLDEADNENENEW